MAITGSGTEQDPYIVDNFAEFDTVRNISTDTYIEYSNDEVDFNDIQPYGYTERFILAGHIKMTNVVCKTNNSTTYCSCIYPVWFCGESDLQHKRRCY